MKKIFLMILAVLLIVCMASCSSKKEEGENATDNVDAVAKDDSHEDATGVFKFQLNSEGKCEIVEFIPASVKSVDIKLPTATAEGRDVVGIAAAAFKAQNSINSITIPATYTYVGDYAFYDCDSLTSVTFESTSVTEIGTSAFEGCDKLAAINTPASIKSVASFAFKGCSSIASIKLEGIETIGDGAFFGCTALADVTLSDTVKQVNKNAFYNCPTIAYTVENGALYLGSAANKYAILVSAENLDIVSCEVNAATTIIADKAFLDCDRLESVKLGAAVTKLSASCFENCGQLAFNESENGLYLGTDENPYMVLMGLADNAIEDFELNKDTKILCDEAVKNAAALKDIYYVGTKADWEAILKVEDWNNGRSIRVLFGENAEDSEIYE